MKSPFRKLVRISIILFATVLLFNFFGYYLMNKKTAENEEFAQAKSIAGRQQTLSQVIAKDVAVLTGNSLNESQKKVLKDSLASNLLVFQHNQEYLQQAIDSVQLPLPQPVFKIRLQFSSIKLFYKQILAIGQEVAQSDSSILNINGRVYLRALL